MKKMMIISLFGLVSFNTHAETTKCGNFAGIYQDDVQVQKYNNDLWMGRTWIITQDGCRSIQLTITDGLRMIASNTHTYSVHNVNTQSGVSFVAEFKNHDTFELKAISGMSVSLFPESFYFKFPAVSTFTLSRHGNIHFEKRAYGISADNRLLMRMKPSVRYWDGSRWKVNP